MADQLKLIMDLIAEIERAEEDDQLGRVATLRAQLATYLTERPKGKDEQARQDHRHDQP